MKEKRLVEVGGAHLLDKGVRERQPAWTREHARTFACTCTPTCNMYMCTSSSSSLPHHCPSIASALLHHYLVMTSCLIMTAPLQRPGLSFAPRPRPRSAAQSHSALPRRQSPPPAADEHGMHTRMPGARACWRVRVRMSVRVCPRVHVRVRAPPPHLGRPVPPARMCTCTCMCTHARTDACAWRKSMDMHGRSSRLSLLARDMDAPAQTRSRRSPRSSSARTVRYIAACNCRS